MRYLRLWAHEAQKQLIHLNTSCTKPCHDWFKLLLFGTGVISVCLAFPIMCCPLCVAQPNSNHAPGMLLRSSAVKSSQMQNPFLNPPLNLGLSLTCNAKNTTVNGTVHALTNKKRTAASCAGVPRAKPHTRTALLPADNTSTACSRQQQQHLVGLAGSLSLLH